MNNPHTRILVTGSTGFIGAALCKQLALKSCALTLLNRRAETATQQDIEQVTEVLGDLTDPLSLQSACADQDVVIHLAGTAHVNESEPQLRQAIVDGTRNLLAAAIANRVRRFIYVSSSLAQAVDDASGDATAYGRCKYEAEQLLLQAAQEHGLDVVILRPVNVYGKGMRGNIATMISLIARNRLPPLPKFETRISLVGIADLVQAIELALVADSGTRIYTVTDGQEYRVSDIEQAIYAALNKRFPRWRTPRVVLFAAALVAGLIPRTGHNKSAIGLRTYRKITQDNLFDNHAICHDLGLQPSTTLYQELPSIVENILQKNS